MYAAPTEEMVRMVAQRTVHRKTLLILATEVPEEQQTK